MSAKNIRIKLGEIERRIDDAEKRADLDRMVELQLEHQILRVYLESLEMTAADPAFLERKGISLEVREEILAVLPSKDKVEVICMVKGTCGV